MGYHRAGFDEIVGVDIEPQKDYPFMFVQHDALEFVKSYGAGFDAIHASPPCQDYTTMNNRHGSNAPRLITETRDAMPPHVPFVIENVLGAKQHMRNPALLTGEMFRLGVWRPRLFETNWLLLTNQAPTRQANPVAVYGKHDQRRLWTRRDGSSLHCATLGAAQAAMGIDWMTWDDIREAIPPAYTEYIGKQLLEALR